MSEIFTKLLRTEIQQYITEHIRADLPKLLLKKSPFPDVSMSEIVQQIKGRQIASKKFPFLLNPEIIFPPHLNLEQASSQTTAEYKATIAGGQSFLDLSAGFGVDAFFIAKKFGDATLVERNADLMDIVRHNWQVLGRKAEFFCGEITDFIEQNKRRFDLIFLDPARRNADKKRVFLLEDLSPNILKIQDELLEISPQILIKLSPLIDIHYLTSAVKNLVEIHIVAVKNDVKEILVKIEQDSIREISVKCLNLETCDPDFEFCIRDENSVSVVFSAPLNYIYIPNNSVLKSGAFKLIAEKFGLKKLHPNTHFYTSELPVLGFPGRMLEVEKINAKSIEKGGRFNIISKNYPLSPDQIRKKYSISDGGTAYLIFTQSVDGKVILKSK